MKYSSLFFVFLSISSLAFSRDSEVEGLTIPNAHLVGERVIRGSQPAKKVSELVALGVTDFIIFKNDIKGEVEQEITALKTLGVKSSKIYPIPFKWKELESANQACRQAVSALKILVSVEKSQNRTAFFHCTVGEDRTGMLAGLFRMVNEQWSREQAFKNEMCAHGYADGNPTKTASVVRAIEAELTPLFLGMATLIEDGKLSRTNLNEDACDDLTVGKKAPGQWECR